MKLITAIIQPYRLDAVREALDGLGLTGATISEVSGTGRQKGHIEIYRGAEYTVSSVPKIRFEILVADPSVDAAVDAIIEGARTGAIGDGKIWITAVEDVIRVRTGERGDEAL
ncbi:MAG: P-II family nitrogen regulator [Schaalia hyovaginalis]|uniref:P-II family nitrogen regulator n=1 Tax=Schaalia hyovaginalis TaxID=29316 RepID=UPI0012B1BA25|nr:P-II family nitrogen regulator [Schaalia hyovaginalis]MDY4262631.1 P-II family nitrogen regulator [Schaalia hyovaginalis]MDY5600333.1 P-II family nitrogen regulator [Schaalia hyovaginalis]MST64469.1 P-II family nitrogen regulator [Schaalia hyovaginalis]